MGVICGVFGTLGGIYWIATEVLEAPIWLAILLDIVVFVTLFSIWVRKANADIRAEEAREREARAAAKQTGTKAPNKKED